MKDNFCANLLRQFREDAWGWAVFALTIIAIFPIAWACWINPKENNVASFFIWGILASLFLYSFWRQGFSGWRMPFGYLIGNISILIIAAIRGGHFDLGLAEQIMLFGIIGSVTVWKINQTRSGKAEPRILYYGCILADVASFYPIMKQWLGPASSSLWMLSGWIICLIGAVINIIKVERFITKLQMAPYTYKEAYGKEKKVLLILEESLFSIEQVIFLVGMICVMAW